MPDPTTSRAPCPACGEPWLRPTNLPGRFRCVNCLRRFELVSQCPNCGELRRPHHIDLKTGMYRGRQVLEAKTEV